MRPIVILFAHLISIEANISRWQSVGDRRLRKWERIVGQMNKTVVKTMFSNGKIQNFDANFIQTFYEILAMTSWKIGGMNKAKFLVWHHACIQFNLNFDF